MVVPVLDNQLQITAFRGLNTNLPSDLIADEEFSVLTNMIHRNGIVRKRPGFDTTNFPYSLTPAPPASYGQLRLIGSDAGAGEPSRDYAMLYFWDSDEADLYGSTDGSTLTQINVLSNIQSIEVMLASSDAFSAGPLFIGTVGGNAGLWRIPAESLWPAAPTLVSTNTPATDGILFAHYDRIWYFYEDRVIFSDPGDYTTLSTLNANFIEFPTNVIGAAPLNDKIVILLTDGIYTLNISGVPKNWSVNKIHSTIAFTELTSYQQFQTVVVVEDTAFIACLSGLFKTNGVEVIDLTEPVRNLFPDGAGSNGFGPTIGIFNDSGTQLFLQVPRGIHNDPRETISYFLYNTLENTWTTLEISIYYPLTHDIYSVMTGVPADLPVLFRDFVYIKQQQEPDTLPATWAAFVGQQEEYRAFNGFYCMASFEDYNDNLLAHVADHPDDWVYLDDGEIYQSTLQTKTFDFGYKGINKKCIKQFMSIGTTGGVDLRLTPVVNDVDRTPTDLTVNTSTRNLKTRGPGYFNEYALKIQDTLGDPGDIGSWEFQSLGLDLINKPEQVESNGTWG